MRSFYEQWKVLGNRPLIEGDNKDDNCSIDSLSLTNRTLAVGDLEWKDFLAISFDL